uniref:Putative cytochrome P450 n=1 Tax=Eschscholzia californica subsp. californica TaxID=222997 RepID=A0A2Z6BXX2_ESCCA|nr:putative cytochrome P450 [Eschscholzia californica subsp. californica]
MNFYQDVLSSQFSATNMYVTLFALGLYYTLAGKRPSKSSSTFEMIKKTNEAPPEPAGSWPVIGHLHLLRGPYPVHIILGDMADKHGPVFTINIGVHKTLIVSDWEVANEIFTTHDKVFSSRTPQTAAGKYIGYNDAMLRFASDAPYWTEIRKIMKQDLLSNNRVELLKHAWAFEINSSIREVYKVNQGQPAVLVEMKQWLSDLTLNMSAKMIAGKRCFGVGSVACPKAQKGLREFVRLMGQIVVSDGVPLLGLLGLDGPVVKDMKTTGKELDRILGEWLEEHKEKKRVSSDVNDWMDVMLNVLQDDNKLSQYYDVDTITKATCMALMQGVSVWTMFTLVWAMALLANNPGVLKKAHDELDNHVGRERNVEESDIKNLVYLQAIIKETTRLYPVSMRQLESNEDSTVANYYVPAGSRLIVNTWKIHRDPKVWPEPAEFKPERFLTTHAHIEFKPQNFQLIPFGSGRRSCPGNSLGLEMLHLTIARLVHGFDIKTPSGAPVDMTVSPGVDNMVKATPLEVKLIPRLASDAFYVSA